MGKFKAFVTQAGPGWYELLFSGMGCLREPALSLSKELALGL